MDSLKDILIKEIVQVIRTFKDLSSNFVIVGGAATVLYDFHEKASDTQIKTTYTRDIDVAISKPEPFRSEDIEEMFSSIGYKLNPSPIQETSKP